MLSGHSSIVHNSQSRKLWFKPCGCIFVKIVFTNKEDKTHIIQNRVAKLINLTQHETGVRNGSDMHVRMKRHTWSNYKRDTFMGSYVEVHIHEVIFQKMNIVKWFCFMMNVRAMQEWQLCCIDNVSLQTHIFHTKPS